MTTKAKIKPEDVKVYRVMRSHDAFNEGELYATTSDDFIQERVGAGLFRELTDDELETELQRGTPVVKVSDAVQAAARGEEQPDATTQQGDNASGS